MSDAHLCCGSAGTYSIFQPAISARLRANKVAALEAGSPAVVATANIGCQLHIGQGVAGSSDVPVVHWIELLDRALDPTLDVVPPVAARSNKGAAGRTPAAPGAAATPSAAPFGTVSPTGPASPTASRAAAGDRSTHTISE